MEAGVAVAGIIWLLMMLGFAIVGIGGTVLWIWMLVDCATHEPSEGNDKITWILIIIFTGWIGGLVYLVARRPKRKALFGH